MNPHNGTNPYRCREFFLSLLAAALLSLTASPAWAQTDPAPHNKRNVLFLIADDLCASLGCYGADEVKSPNIDRLASAGVRMDRAYCQFSLCGPTRCSFMTGLRPDTTRILGNGIPVRKFLKNVVTLPELFRNNGYYVARVGKIYHLNIPNGVGTSGPDDPQSWDYTYNPPGAEYNTDGDMADPNSKDGQSFRYVMGKGDGHEQHDFQAADKAIELLRAHKDKPFFLACGFIRPHVPEIAPKSFFDLYPPDQIKLPFVPDNDRDDIPPAAFQIDKIDRGMTPVQCIASIRAYHATTSFMDAQLGRVVGELVKLGLADNTVIVFIGDHGYCLGQHHTWQKDTLWEPTCRVPMIFVAPGVHPAVSRSLVEMIDIYPTVAALCGLKTPQRMEGTSLLPILKDPQASVKSMAFTQVKRRTNQGRSVRTDRFRYTEWTGAGAGVELYDEAADPGEFTNLANDSRFAQTVSDLKALLPHPATQPAVQK